MGSLHHAGDTLTWTIDVPQEGLFDVYLALGSIDRQADAVFRLSTSLSEIEGTTWLTGHYAKPVRKAVGQLQLRAGTDNVVLRVIAVPKGSFSDVHGVWLVPTISRLIPD